MIQSTATLACVGRRQNYFKDEFLSALEILHRGDLRARSDARLLGRRFRPDPVHADRVQALSRWTPTATAAATLSTDPADLDRLHRQQSEKGRLGDRADLGLRGRGAGDLQFHARRSCQRSLSIRALGALGLTRPDNKPFPHADDRAFLLVPAGAQGPGFLMLTNFRVIMRYNPAEAYALAIGHLADRLRGAPPFAQRWPRYERVLSRGERLRTAAVTGTPRL